MIEALLVERGEAREKYQQAVESGQRAALVDEDRLAASPPPAATSSPVSTRCSSCATRSNCPSPGARRQQRVAKAGVDLFQLVCVKAKTLVPARLALEIIAQAGRALAFMNDLPGDDGALVGSLHRSLSPGKILVGFDGSVKVGDTCAPPCERYRVPAFICNATGTVVAAPTLPPLAPLGQPARGLFARLRSFWNLQSGLAAQPEGSRRR